MNVEVKVAVGEARTVICHMADKLGADLLVMGSMATASSRGTKPFLIHVVEALTKSIASQSPSLFWDSS
ncbi:hypothetical protein C2845_PM02G28410 [Panicum miliaceum]|uniref:UspA domain-containing protein n=1 Tax=Panicum miliaceum TaxID=4540 RepID=A0A3L6SCC4_PANMI|nr:hypothetical protein C2845_PM02G28410 [Panicum miliaceum]